MEKKIVVAGHTCLDIIPTLDPEQGALSRVLAPGQMQFVGPLVLATGGAVPNTGLALHRLGTPVGLVGKVGDDWVGQTILSLIREHGTELLGSMVVVPDVASSYTVILSSATLDRTFFHYPGPNDTFCAADVPEAALQRTQILHFGYPTLMRQFYLNDGVELLRLFGRARARGAVTSLDVSPPDPESEAGQVDWRKFLIHVLPQVDVFLPGLEETLLMLRPERYAALIEAAGDGDVLSQVDGRLLQELTAELVAYGAAIVGLKLGDQGVYLRTTADHHRLKMVEAMLLLAHRPWLDRELLAPAFKADLVGTNGAGDCTVAGFLSGLVKGLDPDDVLVSAVAVGAFNVEATDAVSGIPAWEEVQARIASGWKKIPTRLRLRGWGWDVGRELWIGPGDRGGLIASPERVHCP